MVRIIFALVLFQLSFSQDYWQQHVDYEMNINVDVSDFTYDGDKAISILSMLGFMKYDDIFNDGYLGKRKTR